MTAYYNEFEPFAAAWLRELIKRGLIAPGDVDERSILEVSPDDLRGYTQCHFFAGLGGWSYALRLAGWPDDRFVWTGSCPCQPFSAAGKQRGSEDERHLWPAFFRLIRECRPATVFGEQVAGAAGLAWLDHVCADLEGEGYATAAADLPACSVGAPHRRQRLWWVAHAEQRQFQRWAINGSLGEAQRETNGSGQWKGVFSSGNGGPTGSMADAGSEGSQGRERPLDMELHGAEGPIRSTAQTGVPDPWADLEWLPCADGKARPTQPGLFPLAHGVSGRVGRLRAYGNAIVPQVAAEFVAAYLETA